MPSDGDVPRVRDHGLLPVGGRGAVGSRSECASTARRGEQIDLCPDSLYLKATGKIAKEVFTVSSVSDTRAYVLEISRFFGIVIRMFWDDHQPPHFIPALAAQGRREIAQRLTRAR